MFASSPPIRAGRSPTLAKAFEDWLTFPGNEARHFLGSKRAVTAPSAGEGADREAPAKPCGTHGHSSIDWLGLRVLPYFRPHWPSVSARTQHLQTRPHPCNPRPARWAQVLVLGLCGVAERAVSARC